MTDPLEDLDRLRADATRIVADAGTFAEVVAAARRRWDGRAKPPGSLGRIEDLGTLVAGISGRCPPPVPAAPAVLVFAGDHGVVADGASAWPSDVTAFMARGMAAGEAAINAFAETVGASVTVIDVGVAADLGDVAAVVDAKVRRGTASLARGPAMARHEAQAALLAGAGAAARSIDAGADLLVGGDMGIGNTTPSAALVGWATDTDDPSTLVGPGAGLPEDALATKRDLVRGAVDRVRGCEDPVEVLAAIGGLEIAALAGCYLVAVGRRVPVIVDGVIALAALCMADALVPGAAGRVVAGHRSTEPAATAALDHLGLGPLLDLGLHLGEGTGACLAVPLVQAACRALTDMGELP